MNSWVSNLFIFVFHIPPEIMKNVFIYVQACKRRNLDAKKVHQYLTNNGYQLVTKPDVADLIIYFTCAFRDDEAQDALEKIKEFQHYDAELIVAGCLPAIDKEKLAEIFDGKTISTKDLDTIDALFPESIIPFKDIADANVPFSEIDELDFVVRMNQIKRLLGRLPLVSSLYYKVEDHVLKHLFGEHSVIYTVLAQDPLYHIRISWGCLGNCSYCGIKKAVGPFRSKDFNRCIEEFSAGFVKGYRNFMIAADDVGAYGIDIKSSFPKLLDKMTDMPGEYSLLIRDLSPRWVVKYLEDLVPILKKKKIQSLNIPIQSASPRILKLMNRYANVDHMKHAFHRLREAAPALSLSTHCIVGFPTETDDDFMQTLLFVKECNIDVGYIYCFSRRSGTVAETIEPKVPQQAIVQRLRKAKKFFKSNGYQVMYRPKRYLFLFYKKH